MSLQAVEGQREIDAANIVTNTTNIATNTASIAAIQGPWTAYTETVTAAAGAFTTVAGAGRYLKSGKTVLFTFTVTITTNGTASGAINVSLPVAAQAATFNFSGREITNGALAMIWTPDTTSLRIRKYDNTYLGADGDVITISGSYEAA